MTLNTSAKSAALGRAESGKNGASSSSRLASSFQIAMIDDVGEQFEELHRGVAAPDTTAELRPVAAMKVFNDVKTAGFQPMKIVTECGDDVLRGVRAVINEDVPRRRLGTYRLMNGAGIRIADNYRYARVVENQCGTGRINVTADEGNSVGEVSRPDFQRTAILYADFDQGDRAVAPGGEQAVINVEEEPPICPRPCRCAMRTTNAETSSGAPTGLVIVSVARMGQRDAAARILRPSASVQQAGALQCI